MRELPFENCIDGTEFYKVSNAGLGPFSQQPPHPGCPLNAVQSK